MPNVYVQPTDEELVITGELLSIEVKYTSFYVNYQLVVPNCMPPKQFEVFTNIYPLKELKRFFKVNASVEHVFCIRPKEMVWAEH